MKIIKDIMNVDYNTNFLDATSITIHDTGNEDASADAKMHNRYLHNRKGKGATWHYTVDENDIYQHVSLDRNTWHAGDGLNGKGNRTSISIEMCINKGSDFDKVLKNTIDLCKYLLLMCPKVTKIVQHNYWKSTKYPNGKNCPAKLRAMGQAKWKWFLDQIYTAECPFKDIIGHWAEDEIKQAYNMDLIGGVTKNMFEPNRPLTRAEATVLALRIIKMLK